MRKAFTLIELIFVIVIIGLLAAIAVPKFLNLKQHAEVNSVVKTTVDAAQQAVEAATNYKDLENNTTFSLKDLINLNGRDWNWTDDNTTVYNDGGSGDVAEVILHQNSVEYNINCDNFKDPTAQTKCKILLNYPANDQVDVNLTY